MNRFDVPETVKNIMDKSVEIELIDAADIITLGISFGGDWDKVVDTILQYAYSNRHVNDDHKIICPLVDAYYMFINTMMSGDR